MDLPLEGPGENHLLASFRFQSHVPHTPRLLAPLPSSKPAAQHLASASLCLLCSHSLCLPLIRTLAIAFRDLAVIQANVPISGSFTQSHLHSPFYRVRSHSQDPRCGPQNPWGPLLSLPQQPSKVCVPQAGFSPWRLHGGL